MPQKGRPAKVYKPITDMKIDFSNTESIIKLLDELGKRVLKQEVHSAVAGTVNGLVTSALRIHSLPFDRLAELEKDLAIIKQERDIAERNGWLTPRLHPGSVYDMIIRVYDAPVLMAYVGKRRRTYIRTLMYHMLRWREQLWKSKKS